MVSNNLDICTKFRLNEFANNFHTTHSLELQRLENIVDIKYLEHNSDQIFVYKSIKPDLLYKLSGDRNKLYTIYVEDQFAAAIVKK